MKFKHLQIPSNAIDFLAAHLIEGTLTLFLGAGTSKGLGLPDWMEFTNLFRQKVGLDPILDKISPEKIQAAMDEALDKVKGADDRIRITREILYSNPTEYDVSLAFSNHLLISIASLLIGSKRGHVRNVITLNYDSTLEWFLGLFGFAVNSINSIPSLEGSEDVRIYHPHGFVPHPALKLNDSNNLILGLKDANMRIGLPNEPWREKERQIIESSVCLFIGVSGNTLSDRVVAPLLTVAGDMFMDTRPVGIWIYRDKLTEDKKNEYFRTNIVPVEIHDDMKISEFILKISQRALERQKTQKVST